MKRLLTSILAGVIVFGLVAAFAATLTVDGGKLAAGSNTAAIASCDTDGVKVDYNVTWDAATEEFVVDSVDVSLIDAACVGSTLDVVLDDGTETDSGSVASISGTTENVPLPGDTVLAKDLDAAGEVHVAIS